MPAEVKIDGVTGGIMWEALLRSSVGLPPMDSLRADPHTNFRKMAERIWKNRNRLPTNIVVLAALNGGCDNAETRCADQGGAESQTTAD